MDYIMIVFTMFQTRGTYKIPGGVGVGLPVVESSVDAPVEDGSGVGLRLMTIQLRAVFQKLDMELQMSL